MTDATAFAEDIVLAGAYSRMLIDTYRRVRDDAAQRLNRPADRLPQD
jgi:hypothetical protein